MRELEDLLPILAPPAGGLARLERHIAARTASRGAPLVRWQTWAVAATAAIAIAVVAISPWVEQRQHAAALTAALMGTMTPRPLAQGIRVSDGDAIELPSGQPNVRLYLVQSAPRGARNDMK